MKKLLVLITLSLCALGCAASELNGDFPVCATEELAIQLKDADRDKDTKAWEYLMRGSCVYLPEGTEVTVLKRTFLKGLAQVRVYTPNAAVVVWTFWEALRRPKGDE